MADTSSHSDIPWPIRYELSKLAYSIDANSRRLDAMEPVVRKLADKDALQTAMSDAVRDLGTARWTRREKILGGVVSVSAVAGGLAQVLALIH